jgi:transposase
MGVSARQMLAALCAGGSEVAVMAQLAKGRLREKIPQLEQALVGDFRAHQRFLVAQQLAHIDYLEGLIDQTSQEIARRLDPPEPPPGGAAPPPNREEPLPVALEVAARREALHQQRAIAAVEQEWERGQLGFAEAVALLVTITGIQRRTAEVIVSEIGTDMGRFPSASHLSSWAGLVPGLNVSAGKRQGNKIRRGSPWLRSALVEAAHGASRSKETYLSAQYHRLAARRGRKKAIVAVAHSILVIAYHVLKDGQPYQELGAQYFEARDKEALQRRYVRRLEQLGCRVTVEPAVAA